MKVTFISDTHCRHNDLTLPGGDILIFSGDCMGSGYRPNELKDFIEWFSKQDYRYKVFVGGNHDRFYESSNDVANKWFLKHFDDGVRVLCNEIIDIDGLKIYGTPYQPYFCGWAFNVPSSERLFTIYKMIPDNVDILVTHCPPYNILDKSHLSRADWGRTGEEPLGSKELMTALDELGHHTPRYHVFGHIHGDGGNLTTRDGTTYINASVCDEQYEPVNGVMTLDIELRNEGDE